MDDSTSWALGQLDTFIDMTESHNLSSRRNGVASFTSQRGAKAPKSKVVAASAVIELILDQHLPEWRSRRDEWSSKNYEFAAIREAALRCREVLQRKSEVDGHLRPEAPTGGTDALHPSVWDAARPQWESGHYAEAVFAAARGVNAHLQRRVGRTDLADTKLVQEAFSPNPPKSGAARLRMPPDDGSETAKSMQSGVLSFGIGCMMAIRNPLAHADGGDRDLSKPEALERLVALSLLSRWIDEAKVHTEGPEKADP